MKNIFSKIIAFFKKEKDSIIKPTVVLLAICIIIPLALAVTNKITAPKIAKLEEKLARETMEELVSADKYITQKIENVEFNVAQRKGENIAYVFKTAAKGYGGKDSVTVMTAISPEGKVIGLKILDVSNETPGLGQNASNESWYKQFIGMSGEITINDIDTITSATITSKAVMTAVNEALELFGKISAVPTIEDDVIKPEDSISIPEDPGPAISENTTEGTEDVTNEK